MFVENSATILTSEYLPCATDDVIFPKGNTFKVRLDSTGNDVSLNSLTIGGKSVDTNQLRKDLFRQFDVTSETRLRITNSGGCTDQTGCACGNDRTDILSKICAHVSRDDMTCEAQCKTPVSVTGECCAQCGFVLRAKYTDDFRFADLHSKLNEKFVTSQLRVIISKTSDDVIQIVVLDSGNGESAKRTGKRIESFLRADMNNRNELRLTQLDVTSSGKGHGSTTGGQKGKDRNARLGHIFGIIVSAVILVAVIGVAMYCFIDGSQCRRLRERLPRNVIFRRLDSSEVEVELDEGSGDGVNYIDIMNSLEQQQTTTFDNPMYDINDADVTALNNNKSDAPATLDAATIEADVATLNKSFQNPLFGASGGTANPVDLYIDNDVDITDSNI